MNHKQESEAKERFIEWALRVAEDYGKGRMAIALEAWLEQEKEILKLKKKLVKMEKESDKT